MTSSPRFVQKISGLLLLALTLCAPPARAAISILIDQAEDNRFPIAIANLASGGGSDLAKKIPEVMRNDLHFSGYFLVIAPRTYADKTDAVTASDIPFEKWTAVGAKALVKGTIQTAPDGRVVAQLRFFDIATKEMQLGKQYTFRPDDWRMIAHRFADEIMKATTGIRGPFGTRVAYTLTTGSGKKSSWKQIYVMDVDGANGAKVTKDRSYNLAPNWSPDGKRVVFTSYVDGFPNIFHIDLTDGKRTQLTQTETTNITPRYSQSGSSVAFSSGAGQDMEIYLMNADGSNQRPFSPAFGADLSPAFSPDNREMVWASERGGKLNLYRKSIEGTSAAQRITFSGSMNDSPDWSPDGTKITFASFSGGVYQVCVVNPDGSNVRRLTSDGSNEHPRWSPDSRYIAYQSTPHGERKSTVYVMRFDGVNKTPITKGIDATLPAWGPWPAEYFSDESE